MPLATISFVCAAILLLTYQGYNIPHSLSARHDSNYIDCLSLQTAVCSVLKDQLSNGDHVASKALPMIWLTVFVVIFDRITEPCLKYDTTLASWGPTDWRNTVPFVYFSTMDAIGLEFPAGRPSLKTPTSFE